jgi:NADPH:quinone reductase-like Zn-dependent oxidoreductase
VLPVGAHFQETFAQEQEQHIRAFAVRSFGETAAIHDLPIPAAADAYLIRVTHAGVNPIDYKLVELLTAASNFPFVLGIDFAGVVERGPTGQQDLKAGDRVFGMARSHGAYADYTAILPSLPREALARVPDRVTNEQAAALPVAGIAALGALDLLNIASAQKIVVMGATGGVGGYAVQMARSRGARVIATVRGDANEASRLGAEEVYDTKAGDVIDAIRASHPEGVDAVLDLVNGKGAIGRDADTLKSGGSLASTLHAADESWFKERHITAYNVGKGANPKATAEGLAELALLLVVTGKASILGQMEAPLTIWLVHLARLGLKRLSELVHA